MSIDTYELGEAVAGEILAAYEAIGTPHWNDGSPVQHVVHIDRLGGVAYSSTLDYSICYAEGVSLRRGRGIIAQIHREGDICTGDVTVQPACDDFDF